MGVNKGSTHGYGSTSPMDWRIIDYALRLLSRRQRPRINWQEVVRITNEPTVESAVARFNGIAERMGWFVLSGDDAVSATTAHAIATSTDDESINAYGGVTSNEFQYLDVVFRHTGEFTYPNLDHLTVALRNSSSRSSGERIRQVRVKYGWFRNGNLGPAPATAIALQNDTGSAAATPGARGTGTWGGLAGHSSSGALTAAPRGNTQLGGGGSSGGSSTGALAVAPRGNANNFGASGSPAAATVAVTTSMSNLSVAAPSTGQATPHGGPTTNPPRSQVGNVGNIEEEYSHQIDIIRAERQDVQARIRAAVESGRDAQSLQDVFDDLDTRLRRLQDGFRAYSDWVTELRDFQNRQKI
ncbi:hypothetical protein GGR53DRAFT_525033 [Hypoxylon sp. FL1150]|nr:hypothetical protein GGR53DRAFT_525033 [Hypoxylon sp. FL1150]